MKLYWGSKRPVLQDICAYNYFDAKEIYLAQP